MYFQGVSRNIGGNLPAKTGSGSTPVRLRKSLSVLLACLCLCLLAACAHPFEQDFAGVVTAETIAQLEDYPRLQRADLRGSDCHEAIAVWRAAHPEVEVLADVDLGGSRVPDDSTALTPAGGGWTLEGLLEAAPWLPAVRLIDLGEAALRPGDWDALRAAWPEAELRARIAALDGVFTWTETELDLSAVSPARMDEIRALLGYLPALERIDARGGDWALPALSELHEAAPQARIACRFELFGQSVSSEDEEIAYIRQEIGDENLPVLRQALPLLASCHRLLLDDCGLSYDKLAELRGDFPERGLVWRVRFGVDSVLTDTQCVWTIYLTNENCDVLKYCTEVLYFDVGHSLALSDFHYLPYMTKLQVLIVARTGFSDCSLLTHCPDLEYLEIFSSAVTDLTPLAQCTNLQHLNIANLPEVTDISPLYGLTKLQRLRICMDYVPDEQKAEITRLLPDCDMMFYAVNPTDNGWRRDRLNRLVPRYALLREQIGYAYYNSPRDLIDWAEMERLGYDINSVFTSS